MEWAFRNYGFCALGLLIAACSTNSSNNPIGGGGSGGTSSVAPPGDCEPGTVTQCMNTTCPNGQPQMATCNAQRMFDACMCPGGGAGGTGAAGGTTQAGGGGSTVVAGTGAGTGGMGGGTGGSGGTGGTTAGPSWPQLGYDERSWYFNPNETTISVDNAATLTQKWTFTVAGYPAGGVTIAEGKVFVTSTGGVYGLDLETGNMLWARTEPALASQSTPTYHDGHIYVHTYIMPGAQLYKLKASDGTTVWGGDFKTYDHPGADGTSSPTIADGKVMVGHSTPNEITPPPGTAQAETRGGVAARDIETGQEVWHYWTTELPQNGAMVWSTVTVDLAAGEVFASTGNNYTVAGDKSDAIHAIDLATGAYKWHSQVRTGDTWTLGLNLGPDADTDFGANPIIAEIGGKRIVAAGDKGSDFWVLDRDTGQVLWRRENLTASNFPAYGGVLNNGAFDGTYFYVVSNDPNAGNAVLYALDPAQDGANAWPPITVAQVTWGMPSVANGVLFVPMNEELLVVNARTGQELQRFNTGGTIAAGPAAIAGGKVVVKSGLQYPLDITQGTVMNNNKVICYGLP